MERDLQRDLQHAILNPESKSLNGVKMSRPVRLQCMRAAD
jgi:hypothetical protein